MKARQLCQPALSRFFDLSERVEALEDAATKAEAEVQRLRSLLKSGNANPVNLDEINAAKASFDATFSAAQLARSRASAQGKLLERTKAWIESLAANVKLVVVHAPIDGASLEQVRGELQALRSDLSKLRGNPPADLHLGKRIEALIAEWAEAARPLVRGYASGQVLDVRWPMSVDANRQNGNGFDIGTGNALLLFAALMPAELGELIFKAITAAQPLSAQQHSEKMLQTTQRINELSYVESALTERAGGEHNIESAPWCVLGVRIERQENAAA
jgi:hypothetical protein